MAGASFGSIRSPCGHPLWVVPQPAAAGRTGWEGGPRVRQNDPMAGAWTPELRVHETGDGCRLTLLGVTYGNGCSLQEAADDLVARLLTMILCARSSGFRVPVALGPPDHQVMAFLWELGEIATRGEDIRARIFDVAETSDDAPA